MGHPGRLHLGIYTNWEEQGENPGYSVLRIQWLRSTGIFGTEVMQDSEGSSIHGLGCAGPEGSVLGVLFLVL